VHKEALKINKHKRFEILHSDSKIIRGETDRDIEIGYVVQHKDGHKLTCEHMQQLH
jgi:hypothetical protein